MGASPVRRTRDGAQLGHKDEEDLTEADGRQSQVEVAQLEHRPADDQGDRACDERPDDESQERGEPRA